jgi:hypothetical protein
MKRYGNSGRKASWKIWKKSKLNSEKNFTIQLILLPYFPYIFTIQLTFLPYFPYHFTIQLTLLPYFPYIFTIQLTLLPYFHYSFVYHDDYRIKLIWEININKYIPKKTWIIMVKYISCRKKPKKVFIRHNIGIKLGISRGICFCCYS